MTRIALLTIVCSLVGGLSLLAPTQAPAALSVASHSCSSSYTHAVLSYGHRCLRRGQFCAMGEQANYRRLGFVCRGGRLS